MAKSSPAETGTAGSSEHVSMSNKTTSRTSSKPRDSLSAVRADIYDITKRLESADKLTQKSVLAMQQAFSLLEKRVQEDGRVDKVALTEKVDLLSEKLTKMISDTQIAVASDLKKSLDNPDIETLRQAISQADIHVTQAEKAQAQALSKVNLHIAEMAKIIDTKFTQLHTEHNETRHALNQQKSALETRIKTVETSTANAILELGERFMSFSSEFDNRADTQARIVSEKVSEVALKTQLDFDDYRKNIERRLETLEDSQRQIDSFTDRTIEALTTRIDSLEYGLTSVTQNATASAAIDQGTQGASPLDQDAFSPDPTAAPNSDKQESVDENSQLQADIATPTTDMVPLQDPSDMEISPVAPLVSTPNVEAGHPQQPPTQSGSEAVYPPGYNPQYPYTAAPDNKVQPLPYDTPAYYQTQNTPYPTYPDATYSPEQPPLQDQAYVAGGYNYDDLPYSDPAYAEHPAYPTPEHVGEPIGRPGETTPHIAPQRSSLFKGKAKPLAGAVLLTTTAIFGYLALRGTLSGPKTVPPNSPPNVQANSNMGMGSNGAAPNGSTPVNTDIPTGLSGPDTTNGIDNMATNSSIITTEPLGSYEDNQGQIIKDGESLEPLTLAKAAQDGDPIAEFQLGLSYLQSDDIDKAIPLIRSAANKGQPAAQYRLAKLYERGLGVGADETIARNLTEQSARAGNRIAMHDLGIYYAEGRGGVKVDIEKAAYWFDLAAQRGVIDSQYNLGVLYEAGQGLTIDFPKAYYWYGIVASQGDEFAQERVDVLKSQLSDSDLKATQKQIDNFIPKPINEEANGIFRHVAWTLPADQTAGRQAASPAMNQVKTVQALLGQLGYDAGGVDGSMGPKTRSAIVSFQNAEGLEPSGEISLSLIQNLQTASRKQPSSSQG